mgnify:CR=1 FL=1
MIARLPKLICIIVISLILPLANVEAADAAVTGAALLGAGKTSHPRRPEHALVTYPRETEIHLLASRREKLLTYVESAREGNSSR